MIDKLPWLAYFIFPLLFLLFLCIDALYGLAKKRIIPPVGESIVKFTLVQISTVLITLFFVVGAQPAIIFIVGVILIIMLTLVVLLLLYIYSAQDTETQIHVSKIIRDANLGIDRETMDIIYDIAPHLVEADFIENSKTNELSQKYREKKRNIFAQLLNKLANENKFDGNSFLVKDRAEHITKKVNLITFVASIIIFLIYAFSFTYITTERYLQGNSSLINAESLKTEKVKKVATTTSVASDKNVSNHENNKTTTTHDKGEDERPKNMR